MNMKKLLFCSLFGLLSFNLHAAMITNGNFQTCDLSGWQVDTDGLGDPGATGDFSIQNNGGECAAQVSVDLTNGASSSFANTLSTDLDFSADSNELLLLSFDWEFAGFDDETLDADAFSVFLFDGLNTFGADGLFGNLIDATSIYGSNTFSTYLDSSFINQAGLTLDFQVLGGFNLTSLSSTLTIDNVSLTAVSTSVPEPSVYMLFAAGLVGLISRKRRFNQ